MRTLRSQELITRPLQLFLAVCLAVSGFAQVGVLTQHNNNARTGANLEETKLTVANVTKAGFGKLAYRTVDGNIYAQPLIVPQANIPNRGKTDIAIVATENNSVYAFDADDTNQNSTTAQLWRTSLGTALDSYALYSAIGAPYCTDITLQIGITSTPVIMMNSQSPGSGVIFATAKSKTGNKYAYTLFSLDLATGAKLAVVPIEAQVPGQGIGSTGSGANAKLTFNPLYQLNRPALLLVGNVLYVAFGGHCDVGPNHGWVFAYDVSNPKAPKKLAVICTTPNGKGPLFQGEPVEGWGGIWMSGEGPSADDAGNIYVVTGNGSYDGKTEFSDSVIKLKLESGQLRILDWFTPENQVELKDYDYDLGSGGAALVPNSHVLIAGGKEGRMFLLDRNNLGKGASTSLQSFQVTHAPIPAHKLAYNIHGTPVIWPRANEMYVYVMGEEDPLKQYRLVPDPGPGGWKFDTANLPFKTSPETAPYPNFPAGEFVPTRTDPIWMPGGFLTLSAHDTEDGTGILWVAMPFAANANHMVVRGILRAYDATDVSKGEIWDSESTGNANDSLGQFAKFCPPTVANGKVYVATFQQEIVEASGKHVKADPGDQPSLVIYGLRNQ